MNNLTIEDRVYNIYSEMTRESAIDGKHFEKFILMESIVAECDLDINTNFLVSVNACMLELTSQIYVLNAKKSKEKDINQFTTIITQTVDQTSIPQVPSQFFSFPISMSFTEAICSFEKSGIGRGESPFLNKDYECDYVKLYKPQDETLNPKNHLMYEFRDIRPTYTQYFYLDVTTKEILGKAVDNTDEANPKVEYTFKEI